MLYNDIDPRTVAAGIISIQSTVDEAMPTKTLRMTQLWRGAGYAGYQYGPRNIKVSVNIGSRTRPKAMTVARRLIGWAEADGPKPLILNHEPDKYYLAVCADCSPKQLRNTFLVLDFTFTAPDPRAFELEQKRAALHTPFDVGGTAWVHPVIRQTLTAQANGLRFTLDGKKYVELVGTIPAGSVVEIDHGAHTVRVNNQLRPGLLNYIDSRWFELQPGQHTITGTATGEAEILWQDTWL